MVRGPPVSSSRRALLQSGIQLWRFILGGMRPDPGPTQQGKVVVFSRNIYRRQLLRLQADAAGLQHLSKLRVLPAFAALGE